MGKPLAILCTSGKHCLDCRDTSEAGTRWRQSAVGVYDVPHDRWECPEGLPWGLEEAPARAGTPARRRAMSPSELMRRDGPALWREIHAMKTPTREWLEGIIARLPCGTCQTDTRAYVAANPPDFGEGWGVWAWKFHNSKNVQLGKPEHPHD